jgi:hypothetical protein
MSLYSSRAVEKLSVFPRSSNPTILFTISTAEIIAQPIHANTIDEGNETRQDLNFEGDDQEGHIFDIDLYEFCLVVFLCQSLCKKWQRDMSIPLDVHQ